MNKLRRCLKPRLPAWWLAVVIWSVTIRYSRGLGESSFGPATLAGQSGVTQPPSGCLTPNAT
jgi:hypothetical protein